MAVWPGKPWADQRLICRERQDTAGLKFEFSSLGSPRQDCWEGNDVWIKDIIREDIRAGSCWTSNLGHRLNLCERKGFPVMSQCGWLGASLNNGAKGLVKNILLQFTILDAMCEGDQGYWTKKQWAREEKMILLCSTCSETVICSALCSFESLVLP